MEKSILLANRAITTSIHADRLQALAAMKRRLVEEYPFRVSEGAKKRSLSEHLR